MIAVTYGYSRDHREDLKQWMVALVTSGEGIPQFLQPLDGNASDKRALLEAVTALTHHLQDSEETSGVYVADSGLYSTENITQLNQAGVRWVSRVPETSTAAQAIVQERLASQEAKEPHDGWQTTAEGTRHWWSRTLADLPQGPERWIVVRTREREERARATLQRQAERGTRPPGRSACGLWATRPSPVSPTRRRRSPSSATASPPGSPWRPA
ncbi:MAG: IS1634 family transposase [Ktedonobacterales bacterium]|nr:IS1634 family transposase [Ktedonobacterales bacterium]